MKPDGGPAFPSGSKREFHPMEGAQDPRSGSWGPSTTGGMTLRDYFAAKFVERAQELSTDEDGSWYYKDVARRAYEMADAMLAERAK